MSYVGGHIYITHGTSCMHRMWGSIYRMWGSIHHTWGRGALSIIHGGGGDTYIYIWVHASYVCLYIICMRRYNMWAV